jgi:hypothetical protein
VPTNLVAATTVDLRKKVKTRSTVRIAASAIGATLVCYGSGAILPGLCLLGLGLIVNPIGPKELVSLRQARTQAESSLQSVCDIWNKEAGDNKFAETKAGIGEKLRELSDIPEEEKRGIQELERRKRELQLRRYLDRYLIRNAQISQIGSSRKATLASYNIETAADIDDGKIQAIPGFGPSLAAELVAWQSGLAAKFVFNPNEPINPVELTSLKSKISARKAAIEKFLRQNLTILQQQGAQTTNQRTKLAAAANHALRAVKQAELNEQAANGTLQKASKFISFCCIGLAGIGLLVGSENNPRPLASQGGAVTTRTRYSPPTPVPVPKHSNPTSIRAGNNKPSIDMPQKPPVSRPHAHSNFPSSEQKFALLPWPSDSTTAGKPDALITPHAPDPSTAPKNGTGNLEGTGRAPPLPPPRGIANLSQEVTRPVETQPLLDTAIAQDARRIQQRLIDLGFLADIADGKWGPKSKRALTEFRKGRQLGADATWDEKTQAALLGSQETSEGGVSSSKNAPAVPPGEMAQSFFGGWTNTQGICGEPPAPPPMRIDATGAYTLAGYCHFSSIRQEASNAWLVSARCTVGQDSWPAHIRLTLTQAGLRWASEKGEQLYYRCAPPIP